MFLNELLEDYAASSHKEELAREFIRLLWQSGCTSKNYSRFYTFKVDASLLGKCPDLADLFSEYNRTLYTVAKSYYKGSLEPVDYIRIHVNNVYARLCDPDVYYDKTYYACLQTPKKEYYKAVQKLKDDENVDAETIRDNIRRELAAAERIRKQCLENKLELSWAEYKELINGFIRRIMDNYVTIEEYESRHGWEIKASIDGWSEDNYAIKYFCRCLTGYMLNYIRDRRPKPLKRKPCIVCSEEFIYKSSKKQYCDPCKRGKQLQWQTQSMNRKRKK
ncbi:hypothetical protein [Paenibacillus sp. UNC499MF]|uniref:hypothetical protein n=1 Tax=Paenibacillus sp. UNC499MF TaxID=1502751 RepID=UPI0008A0798E|nr:hypothetical protein [Paenibacillus sp. UNC499MF]SEF95479.1 hypothetical protein SAMN02799616_01566 [Paenibacillus sp. UNC499MF]